MSSGGCPFLKSSEIQNDPTKEQEDRLENDLQFRYAYLAEFMEFTSGDVDTIHNAASLLGPLVPAIVDAVYVKLFEREITKKHFLPRNEGYDGDLPEKLKDLSLEHPQIKHRKKFLSKYLERLVTGAYDQNMVKYLDYVGKIHTTKGGSARIQVPLVQMNALMGFVADALTSVILELRSQNQIDEKECGKMIRSFNKLLWIQNDLIVRHYCV